MFRNYEYTFGGYEQLKDDFEILMDAYLKPFPEANFKKSFSYNTVRAVVSGKIGEILKENLNNTLQNSVNFERYVMGGNRETADKSFKQYSPYYTKHEQEVYNSIIRKSNGDFRKFYLQVQRLNLQLRKYDGQYNVVKYAGRWE